MERLSHGLTGYLINKHTISEDDYNIYQYGFQMGLEILISTVVSFSMALCLNMVLECILFFAVFIPLRSYAGGVHMSKYWKCLICSITVLLSTLLIVRFGDVNYNISLGGIIISLVLIKIQSPIGDISRKLDPEEISYFSKRLTGVLFMILALSVYLWFLRSEKYLLLLLATNWLMVLTLFIGKVKCGREK